MQCVYMHLTLGGDDVTGMLVVLWYMGSVPAAEFGTDGRRPRMCCCCEWGRGEDRDGLEPIIIIRTVKTLSSIITQSERGLSESHITANNKHKRSALYHSPVTHRYILHACSLMSLMPMARLQYAKCPYGLHWVGPIGYVGLSYTWSDTPTCLSRYFSFHLYKRIGPLYNVVN